MIAYSLLPFVNYGALVILFTIASLGIADTLLDCRRHP